MSPASHMVGRLRELYGTLLGRMRCLNERQMNPPWGRSGSAPRAMIEPLEPRLLLSTSYLVTSLADTVAVDGAITLREAIQAANTNAVVCDAPAGDAVGTDMISFDPSLTGGVITLGGTQLSITDELEIHGLGADRLTITANNASRVFDVGATTAVISGLTVTGGNATDGGGIRSSGALSLSGVRVTGNLGTTAGGIYNTGALTVDDSTISANTATAGSGGIRSSGASSLLVVTESLVSGNSGTSGAGIESRDGQAKIINSTLSGNIGTGPGGGVRAYSGTVRIVQSTLTGNRATDGGGVYRDSATVFLDNTVVAGNTVTATGPDVKGAFSTSGDYNLIGVIDGSTDLTASHIRSGTAAAPLDAMLGPLADNGGPTLTHLPWNGSPLLNAGDNNRALDPLGSPLMTDQRGAGHDRILGAAVDIGAVEGSRAVDFSLTGPAGGYYIGQTLPITWGAASVPANSTISLYYDTDATVNGNEVWLVQDLTVPGSGQYDGVMPPALGPGDYYIGGQVRTPDGTLYNSRLAGAITLTIGGTTYTVNTDKDLVAVDGLLSLREAILAASSNAVAGDAPAGSAIYTDLIRFDPSLSGATIVLNGSQLTITDDLLLTGPGAGQLTINGDARSRIFAVTDPTPGNGDDVRVGIAGLKLTNGKTASDGGAVLNESVLHLSGVNVTDSAAYDDGGGVYSTGQLVVADSRFEQNTTNGSSSPSGGGIYSTGPLTLKNVEFTLNAAYGDGGAVVNTGGTFVASGLTVWLNTTFGAGGGILSTGGSMTLSNSTISQNTAYTGGGGVKITAGTATLTGVVLDRNVLVSGSGGGLLNESTAGVTFEGGTITGNTATNGGGIYDGVTGTLTIRNTLIDGNRATSSGGGVWNKDGTLTVQGSTISDNTATANGGGVYTYSGTFSITDSGVTGNVLSGSSPGGGGIYAYSETTTITRSTVSGNRVVATGDGSGGGVYASQSGSVSLIDSTVADNSVSAASGGYGGGIRTSSYVPLTITRSTISDNSVYGGATSQGGGVHFSSSSSGVPFHLVNATVSGNRVYGAASASGGGLYTYASTGSAYITQSTIAMNEAAYGGGVYGGARVRNSIIAGNRAEFTGPDVQGSFDITSAYSLIGVIDGSTGLDSGDHILYGVAVSPLWPGLGALADSGGTTLTHALLVGSPAVDAGSNAMAVDPAAMPLATDQRGQARIAGGVVDMGAYEGTIAPLLELAGPTGMIEAGDPQVFAWTGSSVSATSLISLYADPDGSVNGNEVWLLQDADPGDLAGQWAWEGIIPGGTYTLGIVAADTVTGASAEDRLDSTTTIAYTQAYIVDSLLDVVAVDGVLTLREALAAANLNQVVGDAHAGRSGAVDVILFHSSLAGGQIALSGGELAITDDLAILGLGSDQLTLAGDRAHRVLSVAAGTDAWISGLTVRDGHAANDGGGILNAGDLRLRDVMLRINIAGRSGGGLYSSGLLEAWDCEWSGNTSEGASSGTGGAIFNSGTAAIRDSLIYDNTAFVDGAGIANSGELELGSVTLRRNTAFQGGGAIQSSRLMRADDCTMTGNLAYTGGGAVYIPSGAAAIYNSVLSDNSAANGGGLYKYSGGSLLLSQTTVSGNSASTSGGGVWNRDGSLTVLNSAVSGNMATGNGGGVYTYNGTFTLADSQVSENALTGADPQGGGLYVYSATTTITRSRIAGNRLIATGNGYGGGVWASSNTLTVTDSTIADNVVSAGSGGGGGGVYASGWVNLTLTRTTVSGNSVYGGTASQGGGIYRGNYYTLYLVDTTVSGNRAYGAASASGGGIYTYDGATGYWVYVTNSTITLNEAAYGGGIYRAGSTNVRVRNSIVAGNSAEFGGADVYGTFDTTSAYSLIGVIDGSTGLDAGDHVLYGTAAAPLSANLGALADNSGDTLTHALLVGSPAIDAGDNTMAVDQSGQPIRTDQRGALRIGGGTVDIGSFEGMVAPGFVLSGPAGTIQAGQPQTISWTGQSITATSLVSLYADPDGLINGNEIWLLKDADPNALGGEWTWYAVDVPAGTYTLGGQVVDRLTGDALTDRLSGTVTVTYSDAYIVDSLLDTVTADGVLTLREALLAANTNTAVGDARAGRMDAVDVILFHSSLTGGAIVLSAGAVGIEDDTAVLGLGQASLSLVGGGTDRLLRIRPGVRAWLGGMTLTGGAVNGDGGAILNEGIADLRDMTFTNHAAFDDGGAISNLGTLWGTGLTFAGNRVSGSSDPSGGAVYTAGLLELFDSSFTANSAVEDGGAIYVAAGAEALLSGLTVNTNTAKDGGGIYSRGNLRLSGSVVSGNTASACGGGICIAAGAAALYGSEVRDNRAVNGGGVYDSSGGSLLIQQTSISTNTAQAQGGGLWDQSGTTRLLEATVSGNTAGSLGGGVYAYNGTLTVIDSQLIGNTLAGASPQGGGLYAQSETTTITRSRITDNRVTATSNGYGGGVRAYHGTLTVTDSTIADNVVWASSGGYGGGISLSSVTTTLTRDTILGNSVYGATASRGGGISHENSYTLYLVDSTVSGNRAYGAASASGGGIYTTDSSGYWLYVTNSTITLNEAAYGGGIYRAGSTSVRLRNSIVAANTAATTGPDAYGAFDLSSAYNLIGAIDGSTGLSDDANTQFGTTASPLSAGLAALADNGGPTLTHALLVGSPAVDAGSNSLALDSAGQPIQTDQRGVGHLRILDGVVDLGAYEGSADTYFALFAPAGGTVSAGWETPIRWTGNLPTTSLISLYYDTDDTLNGNEQYIIRNQPYVGLGGEYLWESVAVPAADYTIGAVVTDPLGGGYWADRTVPFNLIHAGVPTLYIVNTTADVVADDGVISLREALQAANTNTAVCDAPAGDPVEMDVIRFDPSLIGRTITLTAPLTITNHVAIEGVGDRDYRVKIDANLTGPVFSVAPETSAWLSGLRLTRGQNSGTGGAISNAGALVLDDVELFANRAANGGGIGNSGGTVQATRLWVHDNTATATDAKGGGIFNEWGQVNVADSSVTANTARYGAGVYTGWYAETLMGNSTVSGNTATGASASGGGWYNTDFGRTELVNVTVRSNTATGASATAGGAFVGGGTFSMVNTVVAGNTAPANADVKGAFDAASDYNLIGVIDGATGLDGAHTVYGTAGAPLDAKLDALADNGGPTLTHAILAGSPAINGGNDVLAVDPWGAVLPYDQRGTGHDRIRNGRVDLGAFEYNAAPEENLAPTVTGLTLGSDPVTVAGSITLTASGVSDDHGVSAVAFYLDQNRDGVGSPDEWLGVDITAGDGWSWTGVVTWAPGQTGYLAQATDDGWPVGFKTSGFVSAIGTVVSATPPTISVGIHDLRAGQTGQRVDIYVTGLDQVTALNLFAQIGDGRGGTSEPIFQSLEFAGSLWAAHPYTVTGGIVSGAAQLIQGSIVFDNTGDETLASGLLATLVIDTRGFTTGQTYDLKLGIDEAGAGSTFVLFGGYPLAPTVTQGQIRLFDSTVAGRYVFYNRSYFDGNNPSATAGDDAAIDTGKSALLPGGAATFANYTSYSRGINGIMVDVSGLANPDGIDAADFTFRVGNSTTPGSWASGPAPQSVTVRQGAGVSGSDRVTIIWADNAIQKQWLQVSVLANTNTGLAANDVFYFGNSVGETGNSTGNTFVDGTDFVGVRDHPRNFLNRAPVTFAFDVNRDSFVDGTDLVIVRDSNTNFLTALKRITAPALPSPAPQVMEQAWAAPVSLPLVGTWPDAAGATAADDTPDILMSVVRPVMTGAEATVAWVAPLKPSADALQGAAVLGLPAPWVSNDAALALAGRPAATRRGGHVVARPLGIHRVGAWTPLPNNVAPDVLSLVELTTRGG